MLQFHFHIYQGSLLTTDDILVIVTIIHPSKPSINEAIDIKCTFC